MLSPDTFASHQIELHDVGAVAELVEVIGPPLRHPDALVPKGAAIQGRANAFGIVMRERFLDGVGMPAT